MRLAPRPVSVTLTQRQPCHQEPLPRLSLKDAATSTGAPRINYSTWCFRPTWLAASWHRRRHPSDNAAESQVYGAGGRLQTSETAALRDGPAREQLVEILVPALFMELFVQRIV
jgi:hypothetical protein